MPRIYNVASYLPKKVLDNVELSRRFTNWNPEKIFEKTGIKLRHIADKNEFCSDMAISAAKNLFQKTGFHKDDIDMLFLITQSQDQCIPSTSLSIHKELNLSESCGSFDINQGCAGYIYGLSLAKSLIDSGEATNILMITSDTYSKFIDPNDSSLATLFGDAATATLVVQDDNSKNVGIGKSYFGTDSSKKSMMSCNHLGLKTLNGEKNPLSMDGPGILNFTLNKLPKSLISYLEKNNTTLEDYDYVLFHQANKFILEKLYKKIGAENKGLISLTNTGNTVSSSIPLVLEDLLQKEIKDKSNILLAGFGVGLSWGFTNIVL